MCDRDKYVDATAAFIFWRPYLVSIGFCFGKQQIVLCSVVGAILDFLCVFRVRSYCYGALTDKLPYYFF